jgi:hypothetical protein
MICFLSTKLNQKNRVFPEKKGVIPYATRERMVVTMQCQKKLIERLNNLSSDKNVEKT